MSKKTMPKKLLISVLSASLLTGSLSVPAVAWGETAKAGSAAGSETGLTEAERLNSLSGGIVPLPDAAKPLIDQLQRLRAAILPEDLLVLKEARERVRELDDPALFAEIGYKLALAKAGKAGYDSITPQALMELIHDLAFDYDPTLTDLAMVRTKHAELLSDLVRLSGNPNGMDGIDYGDLAAFSLRYASYLQTAASGKDLTALLNRKTVSTLLNQALADTLDDNDLVVSQIIRGLGITANDIIKVKDRVSVIVDPDGSAKLAFAFTAVRSQVQYKETADTYRKTITPSLSVFGKQIPASLIEWQEVKDVPAVTITNGKITLTSGKGAVVTVRAVLKALNKPLLDSRVVYLGSASPDKPQLPEEAQYLVERLNEVRSAIRPEDLPSIRQARDRLAALTNTALISDIWEPIAKKKGKKTGFEQVTEKNILGLFAGLGIAYDSDFSELEQLRRDNLELLDQLVILSGESKGMDAISFTDLTEFLLAYEKSMQSGLFTGNGKPITQKLLDILSGTYNENAWNKVLADKDLKISKVLRGLGIKGKDITRTNSRIAWTVDPLYRARFGLLLAYFKTILDSSAFSGIDPSSIKLETLLPTLLKDSLTNK
ncbi:hypothetical protein [Gorillibacterium timonense]|uniref:hypothetical protein n=1 Tax=Gorillibacterium timonense TaxID=1689269 RepID=UPI00071CA689|nr:hypothetical protein [Gorillibacterium timonense]